MNRSARRILYFIVTVLLLGFSINTLAANSGTLTIQTSQVNTSGEYTAAIILSKNTNAEMIQFCLRYDSDMLELLSIAAGDAFAGITAPTISKPKSGTVYFVWEALSPLNQGGTLVSLTFRAKPGSQGEASIWFDYEEDFIFADADYQSLSITANNGSITLDATSTAAPASESSSSSTVIKGYNNGIEFDSNELSLSIGAEAILTINEAQDFLVWSSSNEAVATVEDGRVKAVSEGTAIITATSMDGTKEATCVVTVGSITSTSVEETVGYEEPILLYWTGIIVLALTIGTTIILIVKRRKK